MGDDSTVRVAGELPGNRSFYILSASLELAQSSRTALKRSPYAVEGCCRLGWHSNCQPSSKKYIGQTVHTKPAKDMITQLKQMPRHCHVVIALAATLFTFVSTVRIHAIAGLEGTFEFGLDAPWRIEPNKKSDGTVEYGAIPIQLTIHDARHARLDNIIYPAGPESSGFTLPDNVVSLGQFYSVRVTEFTATETNTVEFPLSTLHEVEMTTGDWPFPRNEFGILPSHKVCRIWKGEDPEPFRDVSESSEWHGTLYYVPRTRAPGSFINLKIELLLQRGSWPPPPLEGSLRTGPFDVPITVSFDFSPFLTLRNYVRVYLAPEPMPRFDNRWLYGDLHYHSQGTDNEGESAYNYRGVIRGMGAMGLDFLFATEHASDSSQIVDADLPPLAKIPEIAHSQDDQLREENVTAVQGVLRDMNADRFAFCHSLIYGSNGANNEASFRAANFRFPQNYKSYGVVPQVFLGGELDAIPEVKASTVAENTFGGLDGKYTIQIPYGNGLLFDLNTLCDPLGCDDPRDRLLDVGDGESVLVRDFQSLSSFQFYGREHMVYFPNSAALNLGDETTFIPSRTSRFGGATRRLDNSFVPSANPTAPLLPEIERKGVVFIAHHLNAGSGSRGPDGVPWTTDHMLLKAYRSPAVLGLEFWNEDTRNRTRVCSHDFCMESGGFDGFEHGYERNETLEADSNNPIEDFFITLADWLGGNLLPEEYHKIALPLDEVRRGFISGGSDGGQFELFPFDVSEGKWQERVDDTEHALVHGAFDWDVMNLRGLDFEHNTDLAWLPPGEPRRMFMAGGSDAHGDFNYRRAGYFLGTEDANDTAIGKPRNLLFVGAPEGPVIYSEGPVAEDPTRTPTDPVTDPVFRPRAGVGLHSLRGVPDIDDLPVLEPVVERPVLEPRIPIDDLPVLDPVIDPPLMDAPVLEPISTIPPVPRSPDVLPPLTEQPVADPGTPTQPIVVPPTKIPIDEITGDLDGLKIRAHTQEQIIRALRSGRFCVTDGPAVRIAIDRNGNHQIDDEDVQMGDVFRFRRELGQRDPDTVTVLTEVLSTPEFGAVVGIDLYVGVHPSPNHANGSEPVEPRVYAPLFHGPAAARTDISPRPQVSYESNGRFYLRQKDLYWQGEWLGDTLTWHRTSGDPIRYSVTLVSTLHLDKYQVGKGISTDRFFVRAFAQTDGILTDAVSTRYAYANPIWILRTPPVLEAVDSEGIVTRPDAEPTISAILNARRELVIAFTGTCTFSPRLGEPFQDLPEAVSPYIVPADKWSGFFRARR